MTMTVLAGVGAAAPDPLLTCAHASTVHSPLCTVN